MSRSEPLSPMREAPGKPRPRRVTSLVRSKSPSASQADSNVVLPAPPTDEEKRSYVDRHLPYLVSAVVIGFLSLAVSQLRMEVISPIVWPFGVVTILGVIYAAIALPANFRGGDFDYAKHEKYVRSWRPRAWPSVDIFLPIAGEPIEVLNNTWRAVTKLARGYPGRARVYVLDDGESAEAKRLAERYRFTYVVRPNRGWMRKAGNLDYAFSHTDGDFIALFDADFAPRPDFLADTLPYMDDPGVGLVQTPQFFRTDKRQTWVERAANSIQEIFYRNIQVSRDKSGATVCCGSCALYRSSALNEDGGFALISYAEDGHTGLNMLRRGYQVKYLPIPLATGVSPSELDMFVRQQYRWASGTLSLIFTKKLWGSPISRRGKLAYVSGMYYYTYTSLMLFARPMFPIAMLAALPNHVQLWGYVWLAPAVLAGMLLYPLWHRSDFGPAVWPILIACGWAHVLAIWDYARGRTMMWQPTGGGASPLRRFRVGLIVWNGGTAAAWLGLAAWRTVEFHTDRFMLISAFGVLYGAVVIRLLFPSWKVRS